MKDSLITPAKDSAKKILMRLSAALRAAFTRLL